jgi:hypothetical protein
VLLGLAAFLLGTSAGAQFLASDEVPRERTVPEKQTIDDDMTRSKLTLGPIRFLPSISVTNAGYDSNVFSTATDPTASWTATIIAGTRLLIPMGSKMYFVADAFPSYTWYADISGRNRWGGIFDASVLGFFNRMSFQLTGTDRQEYSLYSNELPSYVFSETRSGTGNVDIDLTHSLSLFAAGGYMEVRYNQYSGPPIQNFQVQLNNSNNNEVRGGLRYSIGDTWQFGGAVEQTQSTFLSQPELRDNESIAYLGSVSYNRPRLYINAVAGYREGKSFDGSVYPEYQTDVGSYFVSFYPLPWIELQTYGHRRVVNSIQILQPYYFENKIGAGANIELFHRVLVKGYVEDGPNTYPEAEPVAGDGLVMRVDHVKYYGGGASVKLPANIVLTAIVQRQVYVSNIPDQNRNFLRFTAFLNFTGEYSR